MMEERCPFCGSEIYPGATVCAACGAERERRGVLSGVIFPLALCGLGIFLVMSALGGILGLYEWWFKAPASYHPDSIQAYVESLNKPRIGVVESLFCLFIGGPLGYFVFKKGISLFKRSSYTGRWLRRTIQ